MPLFRQEINVAIFANHYLFKRKVGFQILFVSETHAQIYLQSCLSLVHLIEKVDQISYLEFTQFVSYLIYDLSYYEKFD